MPGPKSGTGCSVCGHAQREGIEYAVWAGETQRSVAEKHGVTTPALSRHMSKHAKAPSNPRGKVVIVPPAAVQQTVQQTAVPAVGDGAVISDLESMLAEHRQMMVEERAAGHVSSYVNVAKERRQCLELKARITGLLKDGGTVVNIDQRKQVVKQYMAKTKAELDALIAERMNTIEGAVVE